MAGRERWLLKLVEGNHWCISNQLTYQNNHLLCPFWPGCQCVPSPRHYTNPCQWIDWIVESYAQLVFTVIILSKLVNMLEITVQWVMLYACRLGETASIHLKCLAHPKEILFHCLLPWKCQHSVKWERIIYPCPLSVSHLELLYCHCLAVSYLASCFERLQVVKFKKLM